MGDIIDGLSQWRAEEALKTAVEMLIEHTECCGGYHGVKCPARHICKGDDEATNREECERNMMIAVLKEACLYDLVKKDGILDRVKKEAA